MLTARQFRLRPRFLRLSSTRPVNGSGLSIVGRPRDWWPLAGVLCGLVSAGFSVWAFYRVVLA